MKISELKRMSKVETWHIKARISKIVPRHDMIMVLMYLKEKSGKPTTKGLSEHLELRKMSAERLLKIASSLGLVSENNNSFRLTNDGVKAITNKKVFIPEEGTWEIALCEDPLLSCSVVYLTVHNESNAWEDVNPINKSKTKQRQNSFHEIPLLLMELINYGELIPLTGGEELKILSIDERVEKINSPKSLAISLDLHQNKATLNFKEKTLNPTTIPPNITVATVWEAFLTNEGKMRYWDESRQSLAVSFNDIDDSEKNTMKKKFIYRKPEILEYGQFEDVSIEGVNIHARTKKDAQQWALWRLDQNITSLASSDKYDEWCNEAIMPFSEYDMELPDRSEFASQAWHNAETANERQLAWHLISAVDWDL